MKTSVYWTEDCPRPANLPISPLPEVTDVAIIGGGYTGLNAALALRKAGASVAVLEKETIGWGASSRNGGMALTGLKESMPVVFKRYGAEMGRAFWQWSLDAVDYVEQLTVEEKIDCNFVRSGHLLLAFKPQHFAQFVEEARWFREQLGYTDLWVVSKAELHSEIGSAAYHGGLIDPRSAGLHPARYVFGLAQAAARKGALLVERTALMDVKRTRTGFLVITNRGTLNAREVLVATNGYTTNVIRPLRQGVFPVGSYIITTEPLPLSLQEELSPRGRMFFDSKHFLNYFRLTPDGRMLFGGRHNLSTSLDLIDSARKMQARMLEVFPQLAGVSISHTWSGNLGIALDLMPHAGRVNGVHYAYAYAGHGVSIASLLGKEMGEVLAGKRTSTLFAQIKHPRYAFVPYDRLYLPLVSTWFRVLDWIT
ncbi:NAD(P)/FAD-dependent oxidoreductase [Caldilinea sp.]|jgi:glycine/D-amino acid oxidase-like deaminating enzyme|uniref:NAD(P)/FAD-dependent oxidoreductase n=1 Tax=Caldilinea sp. TaxID=2293560 RepID=UPI0021DD4304|nr:FAD-binding oxidoreductase [Caldilinea sp.]GIV68132.1 MAG: oxidoreductase [Caldilinea sp.]